MLPVPITQLQWKDAGSRIRHHSHLIPAGKEKDTENRRKLGGELMVTVKKSKVKVSKVKKV